ncbi:hypothetical protein HZC32_03630 [Candidatus Woesearchaeota archaeon]|nr:hypothetical protein [Candidatus Woesearchaeota archaeon]
MSNFPNDKKTFLAKLDKSKKGYIDERIASLLNVINSKRDYYTTSSCSGRVYLWRGSGKKNETEWLKVSHDLIDEEFLRSNASGLVWLRLEDFILHVCCKDLESANLLLQKARRLYKKSCILSVSKKIIIEIRGSEFLDLPLYLDNKLLFSGEMNWLVNHINSRLKDIWKKTELFHQLVKEIKVTKKRK